MAKIDIRNYQIKMSDQFYFDTNVWLLIFGTIANYQRQDQILYSKFLQELISKEKPLFISSMVISEFANVLLKLDFKQWQTNNQFYGKSYKKDYVGTPEYNFTIENVKNLINSILSLPNLIKASDNFHIVDLDIILDNFGKVDYNDAYIGHIAGLNSYKIVTNDNDFQHHSVDLDIITTQI